MAFYPNTDFRRLGVRPRFVFVVEDSGSLLIVSGQVEQAFTDIAGISYSDTTPATLGELPDIEFDCHWLAGFQSVSGFEVQLIDKDNIYSSLSNPLDLIGLPVYLYIYFEGTVPASLDTDYLLWTGFVDDFSFNNNNLLLSCVDKSLKGIENRKIPGIQHLINAEDNSYVPDSSVGKCYPVVYGEVTRSPILMTKDRTDTVIHIGICTGYNATTKTINVTWLSAPFPTLNSLANKYLKVIYGTDKSDDYVGDGDQSLEDVVRVIVSNTLPDAQGVGSLVIDENFTYEARVWGSSDYGIIFEVLEAEVEYSAWKILSGDNFEYEGFQEENGVDEPVFIYDGDGKKFLQLDPLQYVKTTDTLGSDTIHILDFNVSYLIGRDRNQLSLIIDYIELYNIFNTLGNHSIQQFDAGNYIGHEYSPEANINDGDLTTSAQMDTTAITNAWDINNHYKEVHLDMMNVYKYLYESNKDQLSFSRAFVTLKLDYDFYAINGTCGISLLVRLEQYDYTSNEVGNQPPSGAHILETKHLLFGTHAAAGSGSPAISGSINAIPVFIDSVSGDDDAYRENRMEVINITEAKDLLNKHIALVLYAGGYGIGGSAQHREIIDLYSLGVVLEREISLSDQKVFYGNIKGRQDFASDELISASTFEDDAFFVIAHVLISFCGFDVSLFDAGWELKSTADSSRLRFGFTVVEPIMITSFLEQVARETCEKIVLDRDGLWSHISYNAVQTFKHSGTSTPDGYDIFHYVGTWGLVLTDAFFENHALLDFQNIRLSDVDDCYSNFVIRYNKNYASNEYESTVYIHSDGTTNLENANLDGTTVSALQTLISNSPANSDELFELDLDFVRDVGTASKVLQRYIQRYYKRWYIVEFTAWWSSLTHKIGDIINVQHPMLENLFAGYATKKWEITKKQIQVQGGGIYFEAVEI